MQTIREKNLTYPFDVSYDLLDEGEGFEQTLTSHKAWYHKYCRIKLARAVQNPETNSSTCQQISPHEQIQFRPKRETGQVTVTSCFFCGKSEGKMHKARTKEVSENVNPLLHEKRWLGQLK